MLSGQEGGIVSDLRSIVQNTKYMHGNEFVRFMRNVWKRDNKMVGYTVSVL